MSKCVPSSALDIAYVAGLDVRTVSPVLRETDGSTPAAGARVTFIARPSAGAGTISIDGTDLAAAGALVRAAQANGAGVIPDQVVTAARYDVIVEPGAGAPAGESVGFAPLDLRTGQGAPPSLELAAPGHITGTTEDFLRACQGAGHPFNPDFNGERQNGVGIMQHTYGQWGRYKERSHAVKAFLDPLGADSRLTIQTGRNNAITGMSCS